MHGTNPNCEAGYALWGLVKIFRGLRISQRSTPNTHRSRLGERKTPQERKREASWCCARLWCERRAGAVLHDFVWSRRWYRAGHFCDLRRKSMSVLKLCNLPVVLVNVNRLSRQTILNLTGSPLCGRCDTPFCVPMKGTRQSRSSSYIHPLDKETLDALKRIGYQHCCSLIRHSFGSPRVCVSRQFCSGGPNTASFLEII